MTVDDITARDARRSGFDSVAALVRDLRGDVSLPVTRVEFHAVEEPDPRATLAATSALTVEEVGEIGRRLARLDAASTYGPWTRATLDAIAACPATRAGDLAAAFGRETAPFKVDVRKLKNLGLTLSLEVGYRLSPRGEAYLAALSQVDDAGTTPSATS